MSGGDALGRGAVTHLSQRLGYGCEAGDWNSRQFLGSTVGETKSVGFLHFYFLKLLCDLNLDAHSVPDLTLIQQEVDALEELSRQLFLETADLYATKVQSKETECAFCQYDGRANKTKWLVLCGPAVQETPHSFPVSREA